MKTVNVPVLGDVDVPSDFVLPKDLSEERLDIYRKAAADPQNIAEGFKDTNDEKYLFLNYLRTVEEDPEKVARRIEWLRQEEENEKIIHGPLFKDYLDDYKEVVEALVKFCVLLGMEPEEGKEIIDGFTKLIGKYERRRIHSIIKNAKVEWYCPVCKADIDSASTECLKCGAKFAPVQQETEKC